MRLLNSVCKVIAADFPGVPVHIKEVPATFQRGCFYVSLTTDDAELQNYNVYQDNPIFQIVYFGERNAADQVLSEKLYDVKERLKSIFLLKRAMPVIPREGIKEKPRYAKIESYTDEMRISEGAIYARLALNFTEDIPKEPDPEPMGVLDVVVTVRS